MNNDNSSLAYIIPQFNNFAVYARQEFDLNLDGLLDRDEFLEFIKKITTDTIALVSRNLIIALVVAPTAALLSKKATEGIPGVGRAVQKIPSSVYASAVVLAVVWLQNAGVDP